MTYQDYFCNSDFEDIWTILSGIYMEQENMKFRSLSRGKERDF